MSQFRDRLGWTGALLVAACAAPAAPVDADPPPPAAAEPSSEPSRRAEGSEGNVVVEYRPSPDPIRLNEPFEIELRIGESGGNPVLGADVYVTAWMPDHRHGMVRQPETVEVGGGVYRVRGLLFHMPGHWELRVDVVAGRKPERAVFDVHL